MSAGRHAGHLCPQEAMCHGGVGSDALACDTSAGLPSTKADACAANGALGENPLSKRFFGGASSASGDHRDLSKGSVGRSGHGGGVNGAAAGLGARSSASASAAKAKECSDRLFSELYCGDISVQDLVDKMRTFSQAQSGAEPLVYAHLVQSLLAKQDHFAMLPDCELDVTAIFLGQLLRFDLIPASKLKDAVRCVISALRQDKNSSLFRFGRLAVQQFEPRLQEFPNLREELCRSLESEGSSCSQGAGVGANGVGFECSGTGGDRGSQLPLPMPPGATSPECPERAAPQGPPMMLNVGMPMPWPRGCGFPLGPLSPAGGPMDYGWVLPFAAVYSMPTQAVASGASVAGVTAALGGVPLVPRPLVAGGGASSPSGFGSPAQISAQPPGSRGRSGATISRPPGSWQMPPRPRPIGAVNDAARSAVAESCASTPSGAAHVHRGGSDAFPAGPLPAGPVLPRRHDGPATAFPSGAGRPAPCPGPGRGVAPLCSWSSSFRREAGNGAQNGRRAESKKAEEFTSASGQMPSGNRRRSDDAAAHRDAPADGAPSPGWPQNPMSERMPQHRQHYLQRQVQPREPQTSEDQHLQDSRHMELPHQHLRLRGREHAEHIHQAWGFGMPDHPAHTGGINGHGGGNSKRRKPLVHNFFDAEWRSLQFSLEEGDLEDRPFAQEAGTASPREEQDEFERLLAVIR